MLASKMDGRRLRYAFGCLLSLGLTLGLGSACDNPGADGQEPNTPHALPPDRTEVKMEVSSFDGGEIAPPPAPATASATQIASAPPPPSSNPTTATSDPSEDPNIGGPQEPAVEKAVAPIRPRIRVCYKKALAVDPNAAGSATFDATLGKDGKVSSARFVKKDGLTEEMLGCLLTAIKTMTFHGAAGQKTQIIAFSFGRSGADAGARP